MRSPLSFLIGASLVLWSALAVQAQDAAELTVRVNRLENQVRQLSGQIEQLQFENRRLAEQLRKFQEDIEFRLGQGGQRPGPAAGQTPPPGQTTPRPRRNDAFDPSAQPGATGAPRQLGAAPDPAVPGGGAPVDLNQAGRPPPAGPLQPGARPESSVAATTAATPRAAFDAALAALNARSYEEAEMGFRQFLQSHPRSQLVPSATFNLGESYFRRNRHRDAAEQYLKVTTEHGGSQVAPDAMLKLGMSLNALGAREQACATYAQLAVRYPQASQTVRSGLEREQRRARCDG